MSDEQKVIFLKMRHWWDPRLWCTLAKMRWQRFNARSGFDLETMNQQIEEYRRRMSR